MYIYTSIRVQSGLQDNYDHIRFARIVMIKFVTPFRSDTIITTSVNDLLRSGTRSDTGIKN